MRFSPTATVIGFLGVPLFKINIQISNIGSVCVFLNFGSPNPSFSDNITEDFPEKCEKRGFFFNYFAIFIVLCHTCQVVLSVQCRVHNIIWFDFTVNFIKLASLFKGGLLFMNVIKPIIYMRAHISLTPPDETRNENLSRNRVNNLS